VRSKSAIQNSFDLRLQVLHFSSGFLVKCNTSEDIKEQVAYKNKNSEEISKIDKQGVEGDKVLRIFVNNEISKLS
jgi:hypothetical protein